MKTFVLIIGGLAVLISLPFLGLALLGYLGVVADVSLAENRKFGFQFLRWGVPFFAAGLAILGLGFWLAEGSASGRDQEE